MIQQSNNTLAVVNVTSVPQHSPFRYPGGKTWLVPQARLWLRSRKPRPELLIEPFAGGGIIGLTAAFESLADRVVMVEIDDDVASVWESILGDDGPWLAERIVNFQISPDAVHEELSRPPDTVRDQAFQTILRNRTNHGGILAPGSGALKYGENGKGISSRWYPETLKRRILDIVLVKDRITFVHGDGLEVIGNYLTCPEVVFFIDPPYTAGSNGKRAGRRLYTHNTIDHEELFRLASIACGDVLMTYDNDDDVVQMAQRYAFAVRPIPMQNTHHAIMKELLIGRELEWSKQSVTSGLILQREIPGLQQHTEH